jgi:hypothetical protein
MSLYIRLDGHNKRDICPRTSRLIPLRLATTRTPLRLFPSNFSTLEGMLALGQQDKSQSDPTGHCGLPECSDCQREADRTSGPTDSRRPRPVRPQVWRIGVPTGVAASPRRRESPRRNVKIQALAEGHAGQEKLASPCGGVHLDCRPSASKLKSMDFAKRTVQRKESIHARAREGRNQAP